MPMDDAGVLELVERLTTFSVDLGRVQGEVGVWRDEAMAARATAGDAERRLRVTTAERDALKVELERAHERIEELLPQVTTVGEVREVGA